MPDRSDSDSSPKSTSSGGSRSSGEEVKPIPDAGSPRHGQQSSDDSGSSDGVLVELPGQPDQDSRGSRGDPESGILVNIDGSMQEPIDESGREEAFEDASEDLGGAGSRSVGLEDSIAVIDIGESSSGDDLARLQARLEDTAAECRKYKEEREVFSKEVVILRQNIQDIFHQHSLLATAKNDEFVSHLQLQTIGSDDTELSSPTSLHKVLNDCSKILVDLKATIGKRIDSESKIEQLHSALNERDQEIGDLNANFFKVSISHDVILSYLGSLKDTWSKSLEESTGDVTKRLLPSLDSVIEEEHVSADDSPSDDLSLLEKKTLMLIKKHSEFLSEIHLLRQCLEDVKPAFIALEDHDLGKVFSFARDELFESKRKNTSLQEKYDRLEEENKKLTEQAENTRESLEMAHTEINKTKLELEQAENKFMAAKEKLGIAVTKGKSLVQHRDSLKQSLAEKTGELEKCMQEVQHKSEALQTAEANLESLKLLLHERTSELEKCLEELQQKTNDLETAKAIIEDMNAKYTSMSSLQESLSQRSKCLQEIEKVVSLADSPEEVIAMESIDRVRWFIEQKKIADVILLENRKIREAISSIELPQDISPRELDDQINWLVRKFIHAEVDISKLQNEMNAAQVAMASRESEILEARKGIDQLESCLLEEKLVTETLHNELKELRCEYEEAIQKVSMLSSDKNQLIQVLLDLSESTLNELPVDISMITEKCMLRISEKTKSSLTGIEQLERMQSIIFLKDQELKLYEKIIEDEMIDRSSIARLSDELTKMSNEALVLKNEKDSIQKELERAEERNSMLREKLSLAVKKGKGLVQEREGFKQSLEEKTFEIEKLKHELQLKDSTISENQEQIHNLSANIQHIEELEANIISLKVERDQIKHSLQETSTKLVDLVTSIEKLVLPAVDVIEDPLEKVSWIAEYIEQSEIGKFHAREELDKVKEEIGLQASRLSNAFITIKSLEDELSKKENYISFVSEEKNLIQLAKIAVEQELEEVKEEKDLTASKLSETYATIRSLEDALVKAEKDITQLNIDKNYLETKSEHEVLDLRAKLAECREELVKTQGSMENYSAKMNNQLEDLVIFINDDNLFSKLTEQFNKKIEGLRQMNNIVQDMHDHFAPKGLQIHPSMKHYPAFGKIPSPPKFEDFTNNLAMQFEASPTDGYPLLARIAGGLHDREQLLGNYFEVFCKSLEEYIASLLQSLQVIRNEFLHVLELDESLKLDIQKLEAHSEAQAETLISLQNETHALFSACNDATRELAELSSSEIPASALQKAAFSGGTEEDASRFVIAAENLLVVTKKIKDQFQQILSAEKGWLTSRDVLKNKLEEAELIAKTAIEERTIDQKRISTLESEFEALNELCHNLKIEVENYQAKETILREKEELLSMERSLDKGIGNQELSESQINALIDKVNKLEVHILESGTLDPEVHFSGPAEKLFFIVDKFIDMQQRMDILTSENKDMQLILASHVHEIEHLNKVAEASDANYQELELKKKELLEISGDLGRIITRLGGSDPLQDQKPSSIKLLLTVLERLTTATSLECANLKSKAQELGTKLQEKEDLIHELSEKVKAPEGSTHARSMQQEITKERTGFEASTAMDSEISEIEDVGPLGKNTISAGSTAAQLRTMRKGSNDHLVLNIESGSGRSLLSQETDAKGHVFKSLNTSGLIPKQGKLIADRLDGIWVSGGQLLMRRPGARLGLIAYLFCLHLWLLGAIL